MGCGAQGKYAEPVEAVVDPLPVEPSERVGTRDGDRPVLAGIDSPPVERFPPCPECGATRDGDGPVFCGQCGAHQLQAASGVKQTASDLDPPEQVLAGPPSEEVTGEDRLNCKDGLYPTLAEHATYLSFNQAADEKWFWVCRAFKDEPSPTHFHQYVKDNLVYWVDERSMEATWKHPNYAKYKQILTEKRWPSPDSSAVATDPIHCILYCSDGLVRPSLEDHMGYLGIQAGEAIDKESVWVCLAFKNEPCPADFHQFVKDGLVYFLDARTGEATFKHPNYDKYAKILTEKKWPSSLAGDVKGLSAAAEPALAPAAAEPAGEEPAAAELSAAAQVAAAATAEPAATELAAAGQAAAAATAEPAAIQPAATEPAGVED